MNDLHPETGPCEMLATSSRQTLPLKPLLLIGGWRKMVQTAVWTSRIVVLVPSLNEGTSITERFKPVLIQTLLPETTIEGSNEGLSVADSLSTVAQVIGDKACNDYEFEDALFIGTSSQSCGDHGPFA